LYACGYSPEEIEAYVMSEQFQLMTTGQVEVSKKFLFRQDDLNSGLIYKTFETVYNCPACDCENKIKTSKINKNYISCSNCGETYEIKNNKSEIYYTSLAKWANFLIKEMQIESAKEDINAGKLIYLGSIDELESQPDIYLARGLNWENEIFDYTKIALDKTILLSLVAPINSNIEKMDSKRVLVIYDFLKFLEDSLVFKYEEFCSKINYLFSSPQSKGGKSRSANLAGKAKDYAFERYKQLKGSNSKSKIANQIANEIRENQINHGLSEDVSETIRKYWIKEFDRKLSSA
jgi:transcription elongation factor Elf1